MLINVRLEDGMVVIRGEELAVESCADAVTQLVVCSTHQGAGQPCLRFSLKASGLRQQIWFADRRGPSSRTLEPLDWGAAEGIPGKLEYFGKILSSWLN